MMNLNPTDALSQESKAKHWQTGFIILAIVAAAGYYFWTHHEQSEPQTTVAQTRSELPAVAVGVATTKIGDMPIQLNGLGTVTALRTVTVHSRVDGELIRVAFTEGQYVKQGDLLAEIDPRPFEVQLKQAEGQLIRDQALLKNAQLDLQRYQTLQAQDSIAAQQTATQSALVNQYQGTVEMDQGLVDNAKLQLTYAHITAPVSGRIGLRLVDQGNIIHASDANGMLVITQIEPIAVIFTLPEDSVPSVMKRWHKDQNISVDAYDRAGNNLLASGKVIAIDNQIDTTTGTVKVKAKFDNTERTLFSNQFVNIRMHLDNLKSVVLAPASAIQRGSDGSFVYVVKDDNTISVRKIKTGASDGEVIAILDGLAANEKLIIDGADKLREGSRVNIVNLNHQPVTPNPKAG